MKRRYNTLNEEMNRMKSLFGESRLYGNLVDKQEDSNNLITEGFKVFDNLADAFRLAGKGFDNIQLTKFLNYEINAIGDMVSHVSGFKSIWDILAPKQNWAKTSQVLKKIEGDLPKIPDLEEGRYQNYYANHLAAIPEEGGLRDIATQMLTEARYGGKQSTDVAVVPVYKEIATTVDGAAVVGTKSDGGLVVYKDVNDKIIPSNKIKVEKNSDTLIDKEGKVIATQDEFGNWVNAKGERIDKPEGSKVKTEPEEAVIVPDDVKPNGSKSPEEVDAFLVKKMGEGDGVLVTERLVTDESAALEKILMDKRLELKQIDERLKNADTEQLRIGLEETRLLANKEVDLARINLETERVKNPPNSGGRTEILTDQSKLDEIKTKDEDKLSGELGVSKESGWWKTNIRPILDKFYILTPKKGDGGGTKFFKFWGSSMVDPFGFFKKYSPSDPVKKQTKKGWLRIYRAIGGHAINTATYNLLLGHLLGDDRFSMSNIVTTRLNYYRYMAPLTIGLTWWAAGERESFCKKLKNKTGICCDENADCKTTLIDDFKGKLGGLIEKHLENYTTCEQMRKIIPDGKHIDPEKKKEILDGIAKAYSSELVESLGLGVAAKALKWLGYLELQMEDIGLDITNAVKTDDGENLLDRYVIERTTKICLNETNPKDPDLSSAEEIYEYGDYTSEDY